MFYHIWFVTKYRDHLLDGQIENQTKAIFAECIQRHSYRVLELETNSDHIHMLVEAKDKTELSEIVRTLKCVSAKQLNETSRSRVGNVRQRGYYRRKPVEERSSFWARSFGFKEIGKGEIEEIREYIRNQKCIPHM